MRTTKQNNRHNPPCLHSPLCVRFAAPWTHLPFRLCACLCVLQRALEEARKIVDEYTAWKADAPVREAERAAKEGKTEDEAAAADGEKKEEEPETEEENDKKRKRKAQRAEKILSVLS